MPLTCALAYISHQTKLKNCQSKFSIFELKFSIFCYFLLLIFSGTNPILFACILGFSKSVTCAFLYMQRQIIIKLNNQGIHIFEHNSFQISAILFGLFFLVPIQYCFACILSLSTSLTCALVDMQHQSTKETGN